MRLTNNDADERQRMVVMTLLRCLLLFVLASAPARAQTAGSSASADPGCLWASSYEQPCGGSRRWQGVGIGEAPSFERGPDGSLVWVEQPMPAGMFLVHLSYRYCAACDGAPAVLAPTSDLLWPPFRVMASPDRWAAMSVGLFPDVVSWTLDTENWGRQIVGVGLRPPAYPILASLLQKTLSTPGFTDSTLGPKVLRALEGEAFWARLGQLGLGSEAQALQALVGGIAVDEARAGATLSDEIRKTALPAVVPGGLAERATGVMVIRVNDSIASGGAGPSYLVMVYRSWRSQLDAASRKKLLVRHLPPEHGLDDAALTRIAERSSGVWGTMLASNLAVSDTLFLRVPGAVVQVPGAVTDGRDQALFSLIQEVTESRAIRAVAEARLQDVMDCFAWQGFLTERRPDRCPEDR